MSALQGRLIITAVILEGRDYHVSKSWVSKLIALYNNEGSKAFEPQSGRPHRSSPQHATLATLYPRMPKTTLRGSLDCHGVFGQWALLKWGFTESRDQYDHSTPEIFPGVQR